MIKVDARGMQCPIPVVRAKEALGNASPGDTVQVTVDNEIASQNLCKMAAHNGLVFKSERDASGAFIVRIIAADRVETLQTPPLSAACGGATVVAVASRTMGTGDDALGAVLMKGFLYALAGLDRLPDTVLFYNGGAFLTTEGSASLEDLRLLESQGVEILTCGTCLDHYGIKQKLAVGGVTNMYAIAEKLVGAAKVIRP